MSAQAARPDVDGHQDGRTGQGAGTGPSKSADGHTAPKPVAPWRNTSLRLPPCEQCGQALASDGRAVVDLGDVGRRSAQFRSWVNDGKQGTAPARILFRLLCGDCAADRDRASTFSILVDRLTTDRRVLRQTLDLMEKPWVRQTDWAATVIRILAASNE